MGDDSGIRFHIDLGNPAPIHRESPTPAPVSRETLAKPVPRDRSFKISGSVSYPNSASPTSPASMPPASEKASMQIVPQSQKARRSPLCHVTARIPHTTFDEIDRIAREDNTSVSKIIRQSLVRTVRRRRKSVKR